MTAPQPALNDDGQADRITQRVNDIARSLLREGVHRYYIVEALRTAAFDAQNRQAADSAS